MKDKAECYLSAVHTLCEELSEVLERIPENKKQTVQEIRLRSGKPVALTDGTEILFACRDGTIVYSPERAFVCTRRHIYDTFKRLCGFSVYSRQGEIRNGFITVKGGHRIGLCGTAAVKNGEITAVTDITSLNIRISRQIPDASRELTGLLSPLQGGILLAGAPSTGKTTILRDIGRRLSQGLGCRIKRVCMIDERGELCGDEGDDTDVGLCDVMRGYPKGEGIMQAIRCLSPQVIICDEVGTEEECRALARGANAGVYIIASLHAGNREELMQRQQARLLLQEGIFRHVAVLSSPDRPGVLSEIVEVSNDGT